MEWPSHILAIGLSHNIHFVMMFIDTFSGVDYNGPDSYRDRTADTVDKTDGAIAVAALQL